MTAKKGPYTALEAPKTAEDSPRTGPRKNKKGTFNQKLERPAPGDRQEIPRRPEETLRHLDASTEQVPWGS